MKYYHACKDGKHIRLQHDSGSLSLDYRWSDYDRQYDVSPPEIDPLMVVDFPVDAGKVATNLMALSKANPKHYFIFDVATLDQFHAEQLKFEGFSYDE